MRSFLLVCLMLPPLLAAASAVVPPSPGTGVAVLAWPGSGPEAALGLVVRADGRVLRVAARGWVALAHSDDPGFAARLYAAGAILVVPAGPRPCSAPSRAGAA